MGYAIAIILPILATLLMFLIVQAFPAFALEGALSILAILVVSLLWGTGPGLLATLTGTLLLNLFILPPHFVWSVTAQNLLETGVFLLIGILISLGTGAIEKARAEAALAHQTALSAQEQLHQAQQTALEREQLAHQRDELRAQEMALRTINQQMTRLIALSHDAIFVRTPTGRILTWNQGAEKLYGWTEHQAIGQEKLDLFQTRFPTRREDMERSLEEHSQWEGHLVHRRRDGSEVIVDSRQVLLRDEAGHPSAILEINRDVSEVERLTQERAEAHAREVALRETKARMDEFLGITSHELRTPLTTIKGNIQLARMRLTHFERQLRLDDADLVSNMDEIHTMLNRAERQVNVQNRLIRDLMDITHIQIDKLEFNLELCDLTDIVINTLEDQRSASPFRVIHLELQKQETIPVMAEAERISQVLSNYLTNALKYSATNQPVFVSLELRGDDARVAVRDEGPGLTQSEQQQVWERFHKIKGIQAQKGYSAGLGLGLHICRAVIEGHHGEVGVESNKGSGATFWFTLPLATATLDRD